MKTLILVRHAKSSWKFDVKDHDRPLKKRGFKDADLISKTLKNLNFHADLFLASTATRTQTTAHIFIKNLRANVNTLRLSSKLYDFDGEGLTSVVKSCDNKIDTLMLFGHNHAITDATNKYGNQFIENVPTCGVVVLTFDIEKWEDLKKGDTYRTVFPRDQR